MSPTSDDILVLGADFGTTNSGLAFAYKGQPDLINVVKSWPGGDGLTHDKVPTELSYDHLKEEPLKLETKLEAKTEPKMELSPDSIYALGVHSHDAVVGWNINENIRWGLEIAQEEARIQCLKLFLDKNPSFPPYVSVQDIQRQLKQHGRTVEDAMADYFSKLVKHAEEQMRKTYYSDMLDATKRQYVLTVPAVWSPRAKDITKRAAARAEITGEVIVISEPEAAARYCLTSKQTKFLTTGSHVIICDAGGGTVDLISYCIDSPSPLSLREASVGTGGTHGAVMLNKRFESRLREALGLFGGTNASDPDVEAGIQFAIDHFEKQTKRSFDVDGRPKIRIPCPSIPNGKAADIFRGFFTISHEDMVDIFDPVVQGVLDLLKGQVQTLKGKGHDVSAILLVGGFGQSQYLMRRVKQTFCPDPTDLDLTIRKRGHGEIGRARIEVLQPPEAWTAVVRGAVLRGLEGEFVTSRRSRYNYGVRQREYWDPDQHDDSLDAYKKTDRIERRVLVDSIMQWFVKKDDAVPTGQIHSADFYHTWGGGRQLPRKDFRFVEVVLYANKDDVAPKKIYGGRMTQLAILEVDLTSVPDQAYISLPTLDGKARYWQLKYQLEMTFVNGGFDFALSVEGRRYGFKPVKVSFK